MKFKIVGTKTVLEPADKDVEKAYLERPDIYKPVKEKAVDNNADNGGNK